MGQKGTKKGAFFETCCPEGSLEGPGDAPGTIFEVPGAPWRCLGGVPGASWGSAGDYLAVLGKPLGALRRHFEGAGIFLALPKGFSMIFRELSLAFPHFPLFFPLLSPVSPCFPSFSLLSPAFLCFSLLSSTATSSKYQQLP